MHDYDVTLKMLLRSPDCSALRLLTGVCVEKWLDVELPKVGNPRLDLLGEADEGQLIHIELRSGNDADMPLRMAEYALGVYRLFGRFPRQMVLYVGPANLRMSSELIGPAFRFSYETIDVKRLDGEPLVRSSEPGDNVLAILTRLNDPPGAIHTVVGRIAALDRSEREVALSQLIVLAGLRRLGNLVQKEIEAMPITESILDHEIIGPAIRQGLAEGERKGRLEGELRILRTLINRRFGTIPAWAEELLSQKTTTDLEALSLRIFDASTIEDLLQ